jgi:hypothetical protein
MRVDGRDKQDMSPRTTIWRVVSGSRLHASNRCHKQKDSIRMVIITDTLDKREEKRGIRKIDA